MFGLFQKSEPAAPAFRQPDHQAAVQVREPEPAIEPTYRVALTKADQVSADQYQRCKPLETENGKLAETAKKALLASLGPASSGILPDGRVVSKHCVPIAAEAKPRAATTRTSITIQ